MDRVYAIGDIHGRADLLISMIKKIVEDSDNVLDGRNTKIVFLGDYIDRGDQSADVIEILASIAGEIIPEITLLLGNHEAAMQRFLKDPIGGKQWLDFGGRQTLASYGVKLPGRRPSDSDLLDTRETFAAVVQPHMPFFDQLEISAQNGDVIFVHAGLKATSSDALNDQKTILWGHPDCLTSNPSPGKLVVHGHYDDLEPVNHFGRICIDTGAYYSGKLSAVRLDSQVSFLQVTAA